MRRTRPVALAGAVAAAVMLVGCGAAQDIQADSPSSSPSPAGPGQGSAPAPAPASPPTLSPSNRPAGFGPGPSGHGLARFYHQPVTWKACGDATGCATIWVPLDYAHPDGTAIRVAVNKRSAPTSPAPNGTLFINPGGPGVPGLPYLSYVHLGDSVWRNYDVVGFDPRGVGQSTPVQCVSNRQLDAYLAADPSPDTPAEVHTLQRQWTSFTRGCVQHSGPLLWHVSTIEAARDMDIMRALVGDSHLNYYGASYGTYLGATYAALFPKRVGRMVLDGAVDPKESPHASEIAQTAGFQTALTAYLRDCVSSGGCPLGSSVAQAQQRIVSLFREIDAHPLPTSSGRPLTEGLAFYGVLYPLYSKSTWPIETQVLKLALEGNGTGLLYLSDQYTNRAANGTYSTNSVEAQPAIGCLDRPEHESVAQIESGRAAFLKASPVFGPAATWFSYACSHWPATSALPQPNYAAPGAKPIVVVGTTRDPATPYQQAVRLANELDSGVLLSRNGDGHTAYDSGNPCIDTALDTFFVTGKPPAQGTMC